MVMLDMIGRAYSMMRFVLSQLKSMKKLAQLSFIPRSTDFGLLVLRLWFGLTLLLNHGVGKLHNYSARSGHFPDPLGIGSQASLILAIIAETLCALCVAIGFATRLAALLIVIELTVAFFRVHHHVLAMGPGSGELPFLYIGAFLAIVCAGPGRHAVCKITNDLTPATPAA